MVNYYLRVIFIATTLFALTVQLNPTNSSSPLESKQLYNYTIPLHIQSQLTLGYSNLIALLKWIQFINYFGASEPGSLDNSFIIKQLESITDLNPNYKPPYYVAASVLPWLTGTAKPSEALLKQAMRQFPEDWRWPFYMGFNAYWFDNDMKKATRMLSKSAQLPKAPTLVSSLALRMRATSSHKLGNALAFLNQLIKQQQDSNIRQILIQQKKSLITEQVLRKIEQWLNTLNTRFYDQRDLKSLSQAGFIIPSKLPDGGSITFFRKKLISSKSNKRFKLYTPPKRQGVLQHEPAH